MEGITILKEQPLGTRPNWDEYLIKRAMVVSERSSCLNVNSGSIYSNEQHEIVASGYNGASAKRPYNCLEVGCAKENKGLDYEASLDTGHCRGIHSETNGSFHISLPLGPKPPLNLHTTIMPCPTCAKNMEQLGVVRVVFKRHYSESRTPQSMEHFRESGIEVCQLDLSPERYIDMGFRHPAGVKFGIWSPEEIERIEEYQRLINNSALNPNAQTE